MIRQNKEFDFLDAFFSDETERFRSPSEPDPGQTVKIRLRAPKVHSGMEVLLVTEVSKRDPADGPADDSSGKKEQKIRISEIPMQQTESDSIFDIYEADFICPHEPVAYYFRIDHEGRTYICRKDGTTESSVDSGTNTAEPGTGESNTAGPRTGESNTADAILNFRFTPGFHIPEWAKGAVQYQIFPDRFYNGDTTNDVRDGEYSYNHRHVRHITDWYAAPAEDDYRCYYGGDIAGIMKKLDYLQDLGIEVIYLNPIFLSPSSHKYDTQDYQHIDPHFGVIKEDIEHSLKDWEFHNGYARRYIKRVTSKKNLEISDALFEEFCRNVHKRGMKIILDGVFNHCGSFHRWMDREGIYREKEGFEPGAYQDENSPYREFFRFTEEEPGYEAWWDVETLPKLDYENSRKLWDAIFDAVEKWLSPPYSIDGWRLDVAADLGHSLKVNHEFWKEFRQHVKSINPEAVIIAEHYGDPSDWLMGDEWDSVMNYSAFMEPVTYFLTGMEKHSDSINDELYQNGEKFFETMKESMAAFQYGSLQCAMNELSNHDHSRFLTRTNRTVGRTQSLGAAAADRDTNKAVLKQAAVIQMTWPGAPTIYYGDEAGLAGWTDPDNRRCYPWGREDEELIAFHRQLILMRRHFSVLKTGSLVPLGAGTGWIAYARFNGEDCMIVACNNNDEPCGIDLDIRAAEARDGERFRQIFTCWKEGHFFEAKESKPVEDGRLQLTLLPKSAVILSNK